MTKGECVIEELGFKRSKAHDFEMTADGKTFTVRVYLRDDGCRVECNNHYGDTNIYKDGCLLGNYEYRYEDIAALVGTATGATS